MEIKHNIEDDILVRMKITSRIEDASGIQYIGKLYPTDNIWCESLTIRARDIHENITQTLAERAIERAKEH